MRAIVLVVGSPFEFPMSATQAADTWRRFLAGGIQHSGQAATLPYVIRRCEREGVPYRLTAYPGQGYFIEPAPTTDGKERKQKPKEGG